MSRGPLRFKETDVRRFLRAFTKEGLPVASATMDTDGNLTAVVIPAPVIPGEDGRAGNVAEKNWDEAINAANEKRAS
jgi:hypothetical protein